jgi:hypothetical protein
MTSQVVGLKRDEFLSDEGRHQRRLPESTVGHCPSRLALLLGRAGCSLLVVRRALRVRKRAQPVCLESWGANFRLIQSDDLALDKPQNTEYFTMQSKAMTDLQKALGDISSIKRQVARSTEFRGYGSATMAGTAGFALLAALAQGAWVREPAKHISEYLTIWIWTALVSAALIGLQMQTRSRRMHSGLADEMIRIAVEQFLPAACVGALITVVLVRYVADAAWMLPGLWQIIFSLGVFSSCRFLPRQMAIPGVWYLITGLICTSLGNSRALSPWAMGIAFGLGQLLVAAVLFFNAQEGRGEI